MLNEYAVPRLPVLDTLRSELSIAKHTRLQNVALVCVQHILTTTVSLFREIIQSGIQPKNIFLTGKHYSTNQLAKASLEALDIYVQPEVATLKVGYYAEALLDDLRFMWQQVALEHCQNPFQAIIIMDDGGRCVQIFSEVKHKHALEDLPVIAIEQTTAGMYLNEADSFDVPVIDVARCAVKKQYESPFLMEDFIERFFGTIAFDSALRYGVIGVGAIGEPVLRALESRNLRVYACDSNAINQKKLRTAVWCQSIQELVSQSDYIIGCTGVDVSQYINLDIIEDSGKRFISCSSEDIEFQSLLRRAQNSGCGYRRDKQSIFENITVHAASGVTFTIEHGGFPATFDHMDEQVDVYDIQLTRGLLYAAFAQGLFMLQYDAEIDTAVYMLNPVCQLLVVKKWLEGSRRDKQDAIVKGNYDELVWHIENSSGLYQQYALSSGLLSGLIEPSFHCEATS